jgi:glycosyltransferase involved in cell wall biosynthesis
LILNVGRFQAPRPNVPHKNQHVLIGALRGAADLIEEGWTLHLVGALADDREDQTYFDELVALSEDLPVVIDANAPRERLLDLSSRATMYWHAQGFDTDATAHPEAQEHFGISTVEAMAAGMIPLVVGTAGPLEVVSPVSERLTWSTPSGLIERTRSILADPAIAQLRHRCQLRAGDFSALEFSRQVRVLWDAANDLPAVGRDPAQGTTEELMP